MCVPISHVATGTCLFVKLCTLWFTAIQGALPLSSACLYAAATIPFITPTFRPTTACSCPFMTTLAVPGTRRLTSLSRKPQSVSAPLQCCFLVENPCLCTIGRRFHICHVLFLQSTACALCSPSPCPLPVPSLSFLPPLITFLSSLQLARPMWISSSWSTASLSFLSSTCHTFGPHMRRTPSLLSGTPSPSSPSSSSSSPSATSSHEWSSPTPMCFETSTSKCGACRVLASM